MNRVCYELCISIARRQIIFLRTCGFTAAESKYNGMEIEIFENDKKHSTKIPAKTSIWILRGKSLIKCKMELKKALIYFWGTRILSIAKTFFTFIGKIISLPFLLSQKKRFS